MDSTTRLARRLGLGDAVAVGMGAMIGAGVFAAFAPAARAAGSGLLIGLAVAAIVAYCNATSSAQLAATYPRSGGTYVYGRERLGDFWGFLAGWGFVVGKTASCAAMALTFGAYAWPEQRRLLAVVIVTALTAVNYRGVTKTVLATRIILAAVLLVLTFVVVAALSGGTATTDHLSGVGGDGVRGILQSAALLFFAFAGYARLATLGEEVIDPTTTIPRAIPIALGTTLIVYATVAVAALLAVGPTALGHSAAPLETVMRAGSYHSLTPLVRAGGAIAAAGALLSLIVGVSRTTFAMASDRALPPQLAVVHPRFRVPHRAELTVGMIVSAVVLMVDLRGAIGFSSFTVLAYYAIANASAWTLPRDRRRWPRGLSALGGLGCIVLALALPAASVIIGAAVLAVGAVTWMVRHHRGGPPPRR